MTFIIALLVILLTSAGQIYLKLGADRSKKSRFINSYVLIGYILFFLTIILSYYLMKLVPMKNFTVVMSLNYIMVMIASKIFLMEEITKDRLIGTILVAFGVLVFLL